MAMIKDSQHLPSSERTVPEALSPDHPHYDTILSRANQIQRQKEAEQQILAATEALLDVGFKTLDLTHHRSVIADVKGQLQLFQPSDYDTLIEERNINRKCGYVFCAQRPRSENTDARFRIVTGSGKSECAFKVVPRQELERWCSERCGSKSSYVRLQLSEEPAWMRSQGAKVEISLLEEAEAKRKDEADVGVLAEAIRSLDIKVASDGMAKALAALELERGKPSRSGTAPGVNGIVVHEHLVGDKGVSPDLPSDSDYNLIEGYKPHSSEGATGPSARSS